MEPILLNDWAYGTANPFQAPETACLYGYGDEEDAAIVVREEIVSTNRSDRKFTTDSGTEYLLGLPAKEYEKEFPGATDRMFDMIEKKLNKPLQSDPDADKVE